MIEAGGKDAPMPLLVSTRSASAPHAIILGAGFAGLLAAQALAERGVRVLLVDRDRLPPDAVQRKGVPQGAHLHGLLGRGTQAVELLAPGFVAEVCRRGGRRIDLGSDLLLASAFGEGVRFHAGIPLVGASRPLLETVLRERVLAHPAVGHLTRYQALGLTGTIDRVTAVQVRDLDSNASGEIATDMVIDATGRGSRLTTWLATIGCPPVPRVEVDARFRYATRRFRPPLAAPPWAVFYLLASPALPRGGMIAPTENGDWIVTLYGAGSHGPKPSDDAFLTFAQSLPNPQFAKVLSAAEPITAVVCSNSTINRRHFFEHTSKLPSNVIAIGDSACTLNPIYGQGITVAALSAQALSNQLATETLTSQGFAHRVRRRLGAIYRTPWLMATTADLRYQNCAGLPRSSLQSLLADYLDRVLAAGTRDARAQDALIQVLHLTKPPRALLGPRVLTQSLLHRPP